MFQLNYDVQQQLLLSSSSSTSKLSLGNEDKFAAVQKQFFKKLQQNFEISSTVNLQCHPKLSSRLHEKGTTTTASAAMLSCV